MQLTKINLAVSDANLFSYTEYGVLANVQNLNPAILIDTTVSYRTGVAASILQGGLSASPQAFELLDCATDSFWVPANINKPLQVSIGGSLGQALRFGFGGMLSATYGNGYLAQQQSAQFNMSGSYTLAAVVRRPTNLEVGGANPGGGPILGGNNPGGPLAGVFCTYYIGLGVYHGGVNVGGWGAGETVGTAISYIVSYNAPAQTLDIWVNGVHVTQATGVASAWGAGNNLLIGAAIYSGAAFYSQLDIAGVALFPNSAFANGSSQAATVNAWLAACKSNVT